MYKCLPRHCDTLHLLKTHGFAQVSTVTAGRTLTGRLVRAGTLQLVHLVHELAHQRFCPAKQIALVIYSVVTSHKGFREEIFVFFKSPIKIGFQDRKTKVIAY